MRYRFIRTHRAEFSLSALCRAMQVSRAGYYAWERRPLSSRERANASLTERIKVLFFESGATYGSPRLSSELKEEGLTCSAKRISSHRQPFSVQQRSGVCEATFCMGIRPAAQ